MIGIVNRMSTDTTVINHQSLKSPHKILSRPLGFIPTSGQIHIQFQPFRKLCSQVTSQIISMIVLDTTLQQTIIAIIAEAHIILHLIRSASHRNSMRLLERQFIHKHVNPVIVCITLSPGSIQFQNIVSVFRGSLVITCPFIGQHAISISIYRFFHTRGILHTEQCRVRYSGLFGHTFFGSNNDYAISRIHTINSGRSIFQNRDTFYILRIQLCKFFGTFTCDTVNYHQRVTITANAHHIVESSRLSGFLANQ